MCSVCECARKAILLEATMLGDALDGVFGQYRGVRLGRVDVLDYRTWLCLWWHPKIHCGCSR